jgi:hypothetical protein
VLVEHRIDHVGERLVGVEEPVSAGEQVPFEPTNQRVLGQHFHDAAVARELTAVGIFGQHVGEPGLLARLVYRLQPVRRRLVGAEHTERRRVGAQNIAQEFAQRSGVLVQHLACVRHLHRVGAEIRQRQVLAQQTAVGVRIRAHAPRALGRQRLQLGTNGARCIEQLLRPIAAQPVFEQFQMRRVVMHVRKWHLMRSPRPLGLVTVDLFRPGPSLRGSQHDQRPARPERGLRRSRLLLHRADLADRVLERRRHCLVHHVRVTAFDEVRLVPVADEQRLQLGVTDARQDRGVGDLVAIQVENRQHGAVADRVDELVRVPRSGKRSGLRFAVADDAGDDQIGVVEHHPVRMRHAVPEFAALMDRAGGFRRDVRTDLSGEGELLEELAEPFRVLALVRIHLGVGAFEVRGPENARGAMARPGDEDHVEIVRDDHPVQVGPDERERGAGAPMPEQSQLHVLDGQRLAQQRIVAQIDHADR